MNNREFIIVLLIGAIGIYYFLNYKRLKEQYTKQETNKQQIEELRRIQNLKLEELNRLKSLQLEQKRRQLMYNVPVSTHLSTHLSTPLSVSVHDETDLPCEFILQSVYYKDKDQYNYDETQQKNTNTINKIQEILEENNNNNNLGNENNDKTEEKKLSLSQMMELEFAKREHEYKYDDTNELQTQTSLNENQNIEEEQQQQYEITKQLQNNNNNVVNEEQNNNNNEINNNEEENEIDPEDIGVSLNCGLTFKPMHTDWRKFIIN